MRFLAPATLLALAASTLAQSTTISQTTTATITRTVYAAQHTLTTTMPLPASMSDVKGNGAHGAAASASAPASSGFPVASSGANSTNVATHSPAASSTAVPTPSSGAFRLECSTWLLGLVVAGALAL